MAGQPRGFSLQAAVRVQKALRDLAGLEPETFPVQAFVGMIGDEIEILRRHGYSDQRIAQILRQNSAISITADEIATHYASPKQRGHE